MVKLYLLDNIEIVKQLVSEVNSYNGALENLEVQYNDGDFFDLYFKGNPEEAVRAAYYGDYRFNDDYVKFNGYGNLESFNEWKYTKLLEDNIDEIIKEVINCMDYIDICDEELRKIFLEDEEFIDNGYKELYANYLIKGRFDDI